jgi:hypothetical protein
MKNEISNKDVVLIALYNLGGSTKRIHQETIAVEADKIAPGRFRWMSDNTRISDHNVWNSLRNAKTGNDLHCTDKEGSWILTDYGINLFETKFKNMKMTITPRKRKKPPHEEKKLKLLTTRMQNSGAINLIENKQENKIDTVVIEKFFKINSYMSDDKILEKVRSLKESFEDHKKYTSIINIMEKKFREIKEDKK